jgi:exodeoxyribonuclease VII large subunit
MFIANPRLAFGWQRHKVGGRIVQGAPKEQRMDLLDDSPTPSGNKPEFTVSELSGAVKRVIEGEFGLVRVRGEVGRVSRPASGHVYFALKDDRASLDAVSWKGQVSKMQVRPEEGMEVVATGRMTTFPGQSKYQLIVEDMAPAGAGAPPYPFPCGGPPVCT